MKKAVFTLFLSIVLSTSIALPSHAQEPTEEVVETETPIGKENLSTESATAINSRIDYELPFPGMLPDHPLYILKVVRDGLVKLLINDPMKKARFSLEAGEKRIYAATMLIEKGKDELAIKTMGKGNNYLVDALKTLEEFKKQHPTHTDIRPYLLEYRSATLKLKEITMDTEPKVDSMYKEQFRKEQQRIDMATKNAEKLID